MKEGRGVSGWLGRFALSSGSDWRSFFPTHPGSSYSLVDDGPRLGRLPQPALCGVSQRPERPGLASRAWHWEEAVDEPGRTKPRRAEGFETSIRLLGLLGAARQPAPCMVPMEAAFTGLDGCSWR